LTERDADTFAWDYEDRMTSATVGGVTTTFAYRGDGLRDSRTTGGLTTTFTWDVNAGLPVVLDDGKQYVYGAGLASQKQGGSCTQQARRTAAALRAARGRETVRDPCLRRYSA
jgi:hypothetical protein